VYCIYSGIIDEINVHDLELSFEMHTCDQHQPQRQF